MITVGLVLSVRPALSSAAGSWNAIDTDPYIEPGSALDLSSMNHAPAGKYGFVRIDRDGELYFEKLPGKTVRFYGTNNNWHMNTPTREDAMKSWCTGIWRVAVRIVGSGSMEFSPKLTV